MKNMHRRFSIYVFKSNDQCRRYWGGRGVAPPNGCLCPQFGLLKMLFLENHTTKRQQTGMEKLLNINLTQYSVLLTRLVVAKETCKPAASFPVLR